tara:strand:- start:382 stop:771 length:390 start_codon:yes stop_codon:yes gene_type:complete
MSLLEYAKDKNMDIVTMDNLVNKYKKKSDDIELLQLLEFMAEKINSLMKANPEISAGKQLLKNPVSKEQNSFIIKSFKVTSNKLYLILGKNEALMYEFKKENIGQCFEKISSERVLKSDIGTIFKKVTI